MLLLFVVCCFFFFFKEDVSLIAFLLRGPNLFKGEDAIACCLDDKPALLVVSRDDLVFLMDGGVHAPVRIVLDVFLFVEGDDGKPAGRKEEVSISVGLLIVLVVIGECGEGGGD